MEEKEYQISAELAIEINGLFLMHACSKDFSILPCTPSSELKIGWMVLYWGYEIGLILPRPKLCESYIGSGGIAIITYAFSLNKWLLEASNQCDILLDKEIERDRIEQLFVSIEKSYLPKIKKLFQEIDSTLVELDEIPF